MHACMILLVEGKRPLHNLPNSRKITLRTTDNCDMRRKTRLLVATTVVVVYFASQQAPLLRDNSTPPAYRFMKGRNRALEGTLLAEKKVARASSIVKPSTATDQGNRNTDKNANYDHAPFGAYTYFGRSVQVADSGKAHVQQVLTEVQNGGIYDAALNAVSGRLGIGKTVVDIGGNFGAFSMAVKIKAPGVHLFTFEAIPTNCANLQANMHENDLDVDWTFSCEALGSADGETLTFSVDPEHSGGGSSAYDKPKDHPSLLDGRHQFFNVSSSLLDTILERYDIQHIDALKIDCEGCEYAVLKSSRRIKDIDIIVAEFHINSHLRKERHSFESLKEFLRIQNPNIIIHSVDINMHEARRV